MVFVLSRESFPISPEVISYNIIIIVKISWPKNRSDRQTGTILLNHIIFLIKKKKTQKTKRVFAGSEATYNLLHYYYLPLIFL